MLFTLVLTNFFQKQIVFVFTNSWSRDQLTQKAYWRKARLLLVPCFFLQAASWEKEEVYFEKETNCKLS